MRQSQLLTCYGRGGDGSLQSNAIQCRVKRSAAFFKAQWQNFSIIPQRQSPTMIEEDGNEYGLDSTYNGDSRFPASHRAAD